MKTKTRKTITSLVFFIGSVSLGYFIFLATWVGSPEGRYSSYSLIQHHPLDCLVFEAGKVRSETCCGDSDAGTYMQEPSGRWIWVYPEDNVFYDAVSNKMSHHRFPIIHRFELRRGLSSLHVSEVNGDVWSLRARIWRSLPF